MGGGFGEGFAGAVHVDGFGGHVGRGLHVERVAFDQLDAAGVDHTATALFGSGVEDVVGAFDVVVEQRFVETGGGRRVRGQMHDGVDPSQAATGVEIGGVKGKLFVIAHVAMRSMRRAARRNQ
ncbi:MAG: hypothetical protein R2856_34255 [Caldilineaceae bacterium]